MDLRTSSFVTALASMVLLGGCGRQPAVPTQSYAKVGILRRPCDSLWPDLMRTMSNVGFRPWMNDRRRGVASFLWGKPEPSRFASVAERDRLAFLPERSWLDQFALWGPDTGRTESAVFTLQPRLRGCQVNIRVSYSQPLESSGLLENHVLATITGPRRPSRRAPAAKAAGTFQSKLGQTSSITPILPAKGGLRDPL